MRDKLIGSLFILATAATCAGAGAQVSKLSTPPLLDSGSAYAHTDLEDNELLQKIRPGCATVLTAKSTITSPLTATVKFKMSGGGVVVYSKPGSPLLILTAAHVAVDLKAGGGYIHLPGPTANQPVTMQVNVLTADQGADLAILETLDNWSGKDIAVHMAKVAPKRGDRLYVVGTPDNREWNVTSGILSTEIACGIGGARCYRTDAAIYFGNSGGGAFDANGALVGIADSLEGYDVVDIAGDTRTIITPGSGRVLAWSAVGQFLEDSLREKDINLLP